jgi:hypothetical protein
MGDESVGSARNDARNVREERLRIAPVTYPRTRRQVYQGPAR